MRRRFLETLFAVVTVFALVMATSAPVLAYPPSPPGANSNDLSIQLSVIPSLTYNGATVGYYISISNPENPDPLLITADAHDIVVKFYPPGADGNPIATPTYTSAPFNLLANGPIVNLPVQNVTLALSPGVTVARGEATFQAVLYTYPIDSNVSGTKNIPLTIINPSTTVTITPSVTSVIPPGTISLTVTEHNSDIVQLVSPNVVVSSVPATATPPMPLTLIKTSPYYVSGDTLDDGILGAGETWTWIITGVVVNAQTTFTANGDAIDLLGNHVNFDTVGGKTPGVATERASTIVHISSTAVTITPAKNTVITHGGVDQSERRINGWFEHHFNEDRLPGGGVLRWGYGW
jgi:hypothetical protein